MNYKIEDKKVNALNRQKFNQYGKIKLYIATCFWAFSLSIFANGNKNSINKNKVEDEAVKVDIIINKNDINEFENDGNDTGNSDEDKDLIFLDQIQDEEEEIKQKKLEKTNKLERFIQKIDEKVNPIIKFQISKSYGTWYLLKTEDSFEKDLKNVRYDFLQQENGYQIVKSYFDPKTNNWNEERYRAWIEEKKGHVYFDVEKKYFKNNKNEILFFDKNYRYMIIRYSNGLTKVFSRYPNNAKISLEGEELENFERIVESKRNLKNVIYDVKIKNIREMENEKKKAELRARTDELEKRLNENPASVFQIDTVGARKELERRMKKEKMLKLETKDGTKNVEVIEIQDKDLKNKNEIKNNGNDTGTNKEY